MHANLLCLGALTFADATGYDLKKRFESAFSHFQGAGYGSIYPALRRLEADEMVTCRVEPGNGHPDRKCYSITAKGREHLAAALAATPASERIRSDFLALLCFSHLLSTEELAAKLDAMETFYRGELDYLNGVAGESGHTAGVRYAIQQGIAVYKTKLQHLAAHRDGLLREHAVPPGEATGR